MRVYIQENTAEKERTAPPDYRGYTYVPPLFSAPHAQEEIRGEEDEETEKSAPVGAFCEEKAAPQREKEGKRGDPWGNLGLGGLFSRIPFLSSLAPPPRRCGEERKHSEIWDFVLLAVVVLCLLNGKDDDVLPLLLLLLLWD